MFKTTKTGMRLTEVTVFSYVPVSTRAGVWAYRGKRLRPRCLLPLACMACACSLFLLAKLDLPVIFQKIGKTRWVGFPR